MTAPAVPRPTIPASHRDLLDQPLPGVLTTAMPDGRLQSTVVWYWRAGDEVRVSTMREFRKAKNLLARPFATLLVCDPDGDRWLEVRADIVPADGDGLADLDAVGERYCGVRPYFGAVVPAHLAAVETPMTFRLLPRVVLTGPTTPRPPDTATDGIAAPPWEPADDDVPLPPSHHDLFDRPVLAVLATCSPDGRARVQPVRCTRDGDVVVLETPLDADTARALAADPRATVLVLDPADAGRWVEVRGDVEVVRQASGAAHEPRVTARLHPRRINRDAVHR